MVGCAACSMTASCMNPSRLASGFRCYLRSYVFLFSAMSWRHVTAISLDRFLRVTQSTREIFETELDEMVWLHPIAFRIDRLDLLFVGNPTCVVTTELCRRKLHIYCYFGTSFLEVSLTLQTLQLKVVLSSPSGPPHWPIFPDSFLGQIPLNNISRIVSPSILHWATSPAIPKCRITTIVQIIYKTFRDRLHQCR